jgi:hypothetical protein
MSQQRIQQQPLASARDPAPPMPTGAGTKEPPPALGRASRLGQEQLLQGVGTGPVSAETRSLDAMTEARSQCCQRLWEPRA